MGKQGLAPAAFIPTLQTGGGGPGPLTGVSARGAKLLPPSPCACDLGPQQGPSPLDFSPGVMSDRKPDPIPQRPVTCFF